MLGPKPNLSTMYGYEAPITRATRRPTRTDRGENSRMPAGFCWGCWDTLAPAGDVVICRGGGMGTKGGGPRPAGPGPAARPRGPAPPPGRVVASATVGLGPPTAC